MRWSQTVCLVLVMGFYCSVSTAGVRMQMTITLLSTCHCWKSWRRNGGATGLPDANELDAGRGYVREEILVREARRLNLDQDDVIIRRRLAQKYEFFLADADVQPSLMPTLGAF